jgi:hypothetical protein
VGRGIAWVLLVANFVFSRVDMENCFGETRGKQKWELFAFYIDFWSIEKR